MAMKVCPKCGSSNIDNGSLVTHPGAGVPYYISKNAKGLFKQKMFIIKPDICLDCGYVEMYINELEKLKESLVK